MLVRRIVPGQSLNFTFRRKAKRSFCVISSVSHTHSPLKHTTTSMYSELKAIRPWNNSISSLFSFTGHVELAYRLGCVDFDISNRAAVREQPISEKSKWFHSFRSAYYERILITERQLECAIEKKILMWIKGTKRHSCNCGVSIYYMGNALRTHSLEMCFIKYNMPIVAVSRLRQNLVDTCDKSNRSNKPRARARILSLAHYYRLHTHIEISQIATLCGIWLKMRCSTHRREAAVEQSTIWGVIFNWIVGQRWDHQAKLSYSSTHFSLA